MHRGMSRIVVSRRLSPSLALGPQRPDRKGEPDRPATPAPSAVENGAQRVAFGWAHDAGELD